jgi:flagellar basal body-associated protein FliL
MQQWYQCPRCNSPVSYGAQFCNNCGQPLSWQQPQQTPQHQQQYQQQYQQPEPPKKKKTNVWLIGCLGLIVLAALIGGIVLATSSGTPASAPTTTEKPTITATEKAYALTIVDQTTTMSKALTELHDLLQNYQLGNDEWTINVATQLAIIRMVYDDAMTLEPPNSMVEIHYKYVQGLKHYHTMTDLLARGIDELDVNLIEQAATEMDTGTDYITEATNLVNDFTESKSK